MAHPVRLILCDIDGTLQPAGPSSPSPRVVDAFHAAHAAGIRCGSVSGRDLARIAPAFGDDEACLATAIGSNGMQVRLDGRLLRSETLPLDAIRRAVEVMRHVPNSFSGVSSEHGYHLITGSMEGLVGERRARFGITETGGVVPDVVTTKYNIFLTPDRDLTLEVAGRLREAAPEIEFIIERPGAIDTALRGCSKANAVQLICDELGLGLDEVVVFGDSGNDAEMLAHVPNSVAVANAWPEAAEAARWHIGPVTEDAVPAAIEELAAGRWPFER